MTACNPGFASVVATVAGTADAGVRSDVGPPQRSDGSARTTTLATGDTVTVSGGATSVKAGPGRSGVTFLTRRVDGRLRVVPSDALAQATPLAAPREAPAAGHDLSLVHTGRDGAPATTFETVVFNLGTSDVYEMEPGVAARTVRVPAGRYAVLSKVVGEPVAVRGRQREVRGGTGRPELRGAHARAPDELCRTRGLRVPDGRERRADPHGVDEFPPAARRPSARVLA